ITQNRAGFARTGGGHGRTDFREASRSRLAYFAGDEGFKRVQIQSSFGHHASLRKHGKAIAAAHQEVVDGHAVDAAGIHRFAAKLEVNDPSTRRRVTIESKS